MTLELKVCTCGLIMKLIQRTGLRYCENCDRLQECELQAEPGKDRLKRRVPTTYDRRFHLAWEERKREHYGA